MNKKNCPFRRRIVVGYKEGVRVYKDEFAWCDRDKCMAYRNGRCMRLESSKKER